MLACAGDNVSSQDRGTYGGGIFASGPLGDNVTMYVQFESLAQHISFMPL